jgi:predicted transcriptional regulator
MARTPAPTLLGELEAAIMDFLWTHGAADPKAVHSAIGEARGITVNTIQSTLKRLFEKQLLVRVKISHAHVYEPALSRDTFHREALDQLVAQWRAGAPNALASAFVSIAEQAGEEQLDELERLIAERRRTKDGAR